jgi:lincosamide nucleotidyltransferase A/C/D/E
MTPAEEVLAVMNRLRDAGIDAWLDGGWGVDALLGEQTRDHEDVDLVIETAHLDDAIAALAPLGYAIVEDDMPAHVVLSSDDGRAIDIHPVVFDEGGGGVQTLHGGRTYRYPPQGFRGRGTVAGRELPCLTAEVQLECHTGYEPTDVDRHDVRLLAERFGLRLPRAYR